MADMHLAARNLGNDAVIDVMKTIPREEFVPDNLRAVAYEDAALPIGEGQTISQPFVVARMLALADPRPDDVALEVGAGSGYAAAVLSRLTARVYAIERLKALADRAKATLARLDFDNVDIIHGDGAGGLPAKAPFDIIIVSAGAAEIPDALRDQLAIGGRLIIPVQHGQAQILTRTRRTGPDDYEFEKFDLVIFVPLVMNEKDPDSEGALGL